MSKTNIVKSIIVFFCFPLYSQTVANLEIGVGYHEPQAQYTKYVDSGFSIRAMYSHNSSKLKFLKYDFGFQYLQFKSDVRWDNIPLENDDNGIPVEIVNAEKSYALVLGPRIMSPTRRGFIRPYIGVKGGFFWFREKITWDWADGVHFYYDNEDEDWDYHADQSTATKTLDFTGYVGWMLEFGSNFIIN